MLLARITPVIPNWLVNIASPHVNIPLGTFFVGTFFGVAPLSLIHVSSGAALHEMTSLDVVSPLKLHNLFIIFSLTALIILLLLFKKIFFRQDRSLNGPASTQKED